MATATTLQSTPAHQSGGIFQSTSSASHTDSGITVPRGPTRSTLTFYAPPADGSTPWNYVETQPEGQPQRNYTEFPQEVDLNDIRGHEHEYDLDKHAFAVVQGVGSEEKDFNDDEHIKDVYYPEIEKLILNEVPGAKRVLLFDHTIRRSGPNAPRAPVNRAHIDQTAYSSKLRVEHHLPEEAEELLKNRVRIINVWRPLNGPVVASPLAFAASDSVPDSVVVPVEHRYPHRTGETAGIKYSDKAKWFYWSGMTNTERLFLQCYDSEKGARVPHTAFKDSRTQPDWPGRESIEVRALVFG